MSRLSDTEIVALLLVQRLVDSGAAPLKTSEFATVQEAVGDLEQLLGRDALSMSELAGVGLDMGERIAPTGRAVGFQCSRRTGHGAFNVS